MNFRLIAGIMAMLLPDPGTAAPLPDADLDPAERVILLCDAGKGRLHIRAIGDHDDDDATYPERTLIEVVNFVGMSHGQYRTFKTRSYRCGRYEIRFSGDALNSNIQGELGAEPAFLSVSIYRGKTTILATKRLVMCQSGDQSPRWGQCPSDYASRVSIYYEGERSIVTMATDQIADELDAEIITTMTCSQVSDASVSNIVACPRADR